MLVALLVSSLTSLTSLTSVVGSGRAAAAPAAASMGQAAAASTSWVTGVDTSQYQHPNGAAIDWATVRASGVRFAFLRATRGSSPSGPGRYTDPWFATDWQAAGDAGLYRGAYHYGTPSLPISNARADAQHFVAVTGSMHGPRDLPPVLDLEEADGLDPDQLGDWTAAWLDEVTRLTGRRPMIYTGQAFWQDAMAGTRRFSDELLWYARWNSGDAPAGLIPGWSDWTFWQWTIGTSPGISSNVDLDRFRGSVADLEALTAPVAAAPAVATNADGRLEVFQSSASGDVSHTWQRAPNSAWSGFVPLDGQRLIGAPDAVANADGRLEVFGVTFGGAVVHTWQRAPNSAWSGWVALAPGPVAGFDVSVVRNTDGRLELFARGPQGQLLHQWQWGAGTGWSGWASLAGDLDSTPTAIVDAGGRVNVVAEGSSGTLHQLRQQVAGSTWSAWADRGGSLDGRPASELTGDGRVAAFASSGSAVALDAETSSGGPWYSWTTLAGSFSPRHRPGRRPQPRRPARGLRHPVRRLAGARLEHRLRVVGLGRPDHRRVRRRPGRGQRGRTPRGLLGAGRARRARLAAGPRQRLDAGHRPLSDRAGGRPAAGVGARRVGRRASRSGAPPTTGTLPRP